MIEKFGLGHLLERNLDQLSGGELQRVAICATLLKQADVYFFDEPSSYLDIYERMRIVRIIQELSESARVIVIEHDLAVLDVIADLTHIVYGKKGAFGIFTPARTTRKAINAYIEGYLPEQNVRIRDKPIKFLEHPPRTGWDGMGLVEWPKLSKKLGSFSLESNAGELLSGQVLGVVGANATGKTTFVKMLAGELNPDEGEIENEIAVSYKPQYIDIQEGMIVEDLLKSVEGYDEHTFSTELSRPLNLEPLLEREMQTLATSSGVANFFRAIVAVARFIVSSSIPCSTFFGVIVHPGATAFTLILPIVATSFFKLIKRPVVIAPFAAA